MKRFASGFALLGSIVLPCCVLLGAVLLLEFTPLRAETLTGGVAVIQAPANAIAPDVLMDPAGTLHMVYGLDHHGWYQQSTNHGLSFTAPVKIDSAGSVETRMGERGPKLALGQNGAVHVVWMDEWSPGVKTFVRYSRSLDSGRTFLPSQTLSPMSGVDGATVTADSKGNVVAFWHVMADPKPQVKEATWLFTTRSANRGASFGPAEKVNIANLSALACSMCMMRPLALPGGQVALAFRSAEDSIRDFYVLKGPISENRFTAVRVNRDNWNIDFCPMCGPELRLAPEGQALCAFMTRHHVYWAVADPELKQFRMHVPTPGHEEDEIYPSAVANPNGEVLFLWQVGPMATKGETTVKWALYTKEGKPAEKAGVIGKSFAGTKAAAFVGQDGKFYIVTTAKP